MKDMLQKIIDELRNPEASDFSLYYADVPDELLFSRLIDRLGKGRPDAQDYSKEKLLSYYQEVKRDQPELWQSWNVSPKLERRLLRVLQTKPRRTASGVATVTVITKPWRCGSDCLYCPNDVRMPKSYLSDEPACQRAERNFFDPYLQVQARLQVLERMGHLTDKVEIIVLGGSWCDYPKDYQVWFVKELFRALNDGESGRIEAEAWRQKYLDAGYLDDKEQIVQRAQDMQQLVDDGELTYNQAIARLYGIDDEGSASSAGDDFEIARMRAGLPGEPTDAISVDVFLHELTHLQRANETAKHRMVGFTVETRPDLVNAEALTLMRRLGVTRLQIGVQGLDPQVLQMNRRKTSSEQIRNAFALSRAFGFKIHGHFMQNLYGSTRDNDAAEYVQFMTDPAYIPDEIKLYPCSLIAGTGLVAHYADGSWQPYAEQELIELLAENTVNTPPFVRISRMIRDISSHDIMAGSKRTNLRQLVEKHIADTGGTMQEIRHREISNSEVIHEDLNLEIMSFDTSVSKEHFLQWVTDDGRIAGFLRLSLPLPTRSEYLPVGEDCLPTSLDEAMIREVHVYGKVAAISRSGDGAQHKRSEAVALAPASRAKRSEGHERAQHFGLGRQLVEKACDIAREAGYTKMNVISSVGTREYYRNLDFTDADLYQTRDLKS